jgi:23S rRNA (pseudouridine1915-N3)-methyltransferase
VKLAIVCIGKLKSDAEAVLVRRYGERLDALARQTSIGPLSFAELPESRAASAAERRRQEAELLLARCPPGFLLVPLDERGGQMSSEDFAGRLRSWRDSGAPGVAFAIGGADGHGAAVTEPAALNLSLGKMTLPHGIARAVLTEQLYRAATIIAGHPYHRA